MSKAAVFEAFVSRKAEQAAQQDDVKRAPFPRKFGFTCPSCGSVHATRKEVTECGDVG